MNSTHNRKRYDRLYQMTGDMDWMAKYAEEAVKTDTHNPYFKFQPISEFIDEYLYANHEPFEPDQVQGLLGAVAADVVAEHWKKSQDLKADALRSIKLTNRPADLLAESLLKFSPEDFNDIIKGIHSAFDKLEPKTRAVAAKLEDPDLKNLIKFTVIRGSLHAYWTFIFRNPIALVMGQDSAELPLGRQAMVRTAAEGETEDPDQEDLEAGDYDEGDLPVGQDPYFDPTLQRKKKKQPNKDQLERIQKKIEDRRYRERDIENLPANYVPLSQAIKALRLVRARHAHAIFKNGEDAKTRADYVIADATISFMQTLHKSIQAYVADNPERAGLMLSRQRLGGADGKGDILVATDKNNVGNLPGMFITSLRTGTYRNVSIPWVNHAKENQFFSARKIAGPVIPSPQSIFKGFVAKKYRNVDSYKQEMLDTIVEDTKLLNEYNKHIAGKGPSQNTIGTIKNMLANEGKEASEAVARQVASAVWLAATKHMDAIFADAKGADGIRQACDSDTGVQDSGLMKSLIAELDRMPPENVPNSDGFRKVFVSAILSDMELITNPHSIVGRFKQDILGTFSSNTRVADGSEFTDPAKAAELFELARNAAIMALDAEDQKQGFVSDALAGKVRDSANYAYIMRTIAGGAAKIDAGSPLRHLVDSYVKFLKNPKKEAPVVSIIAAAAKAVAPDAFSGFKSFGDGWLETHYNAGGSQIFEYKDQMSAKAYKELDSFSKFTTEEVSEETRKEYAKALGDETVGVFAEKLFKTVEGREDRQRYLAKEVGLSEEEIAKFLTSGGKIQAMPATLVESLKVPAGTEKASKLLGVMRQPDFSRHSAAMFVEVLGSGLFPEVDSGHFVKQHKELLTSTNVKTIRQQKIPQLKEIYDEISRRPEAFGIPTKPDPVVVSEIKNDESIRPEHRGPYAMIETLRRWMTEWKSNDVNHPREKLLAFLLNKVGPEYANNMTVNAMYEYVGQRYVMSLGSIWVPMSYSKKESSGGEARLVSLLHAATLRSFAKAKTRGGPQDVEQPDDYEFEGDGESGTEHSYQEPTDEEFGEMSSPIHDEDLQEAHKEMAARDYVKQDDTGGSEGGIADFRERAITETENWVAHIMSPEAQFQITEIRKIKYTKRDPKTKQPIITREMTEEMKRNRGWSHLSSHTPGGWIQTLMGDSISPTIPSALKDLRSFVCFAKWACAKSFGNRLDHQNSKRIANAWSGPTAVVNSKWHLMEEVGAFADPLHSYMRQNEAFGDYEMDKLRSGYNANESDTAEKHFERAKNACDNLEPRAVKAELKRYFSERKAELLRRFPQLKDKGLENFVFEFKRLEGVPNSQNYSNDPYGKRTVEDMRRMFASKGLTAKDLESYASHMKLQGMRKNAFNFGPEMEDAEFADLEVLWNRDAEMFADFERVSAWRIDSREQIIAAFNKVIPPGQPDIARWAEPILTKLVSSIMPNSAEETKFFGLPIATRITILRTFVDRMDQQAPETNGLKIALIQVLGEVEMRGSEADNVINTYHQSVLTATTRVADAMKKAEEKRKVDLAKQEEERLERLNKEMLEKQNQPEDEDELAKKVMDETAPITEGIPPSPVVPAQQPAGQPAQPPRPRTVLRQREETPAAVPEAQVPQAQPVLEAPSEPTVPTQPVPKEPVPVRQAPKPFVMPDDDDDMMALDGMFESSRSDQTGLDDNDEMVQDGDEGYQLIE